MNQDGHGKCGGREYAAQLPLGMKNLFLQLMALGCQPCLKMPPLKRAVLTLLRAACMQ